MFIFVLVLSQFKFLFKYFIELLLVFLYYFFRRCLSPLDIHPHSTESDTRSVFNCGISAKPHKNWTIFPQHFRFWGRKVMTSVPSRRRCTALGLSSFFIDIPTFFVCFLHFLISVIFNHFSLFS